MQPRDVFDGMLVAVLSIAIYIELVAPSLSTTRLWAVVDTLTNLNIAIYIVLAGVLGVTFVGYIAIYLPRKQSKNPTR